MFKHLKKLLTHQASHETQLLPASLDAQPPGQGPIINVNLDGLDKSSQAEFRQAVTEKSGVSFFTGHVEHGYSLDSVADAEQCPRCHAPTQLHYANFIYATDVAARVLLAPAGYFCATCPTVVVDEEFIRNGVTRGFEFHGVAGVDYEGRQPPDFLKIWNGERTVFLLDEDENLVGVVNHGMAAHSIAHHPQPDMGKLAEKAKRKRQMARRARKQNRRKR